MLFRKKSISPPIVPDPGQPVRLLGWGTSGRGEVRAISEPYTDARGEVMVRVTEEREYLDAMREGRQAIGIPWPVRHMLVISPSGTLDAFETAPEEEDRGWHTSSERRSWWRRLFE
jgi:hypothetical protein